MEEEPMSEQPTTNGPGIEGEPSSEITASEIVSILRELKDQGVDFEEEDVAHISAMDEEERVGYIFQALLEAGIEDPEEVLREKGLLE